MAGRTSALSLACGLVLAMALSGCEQLVVFDHYPASGGTSGTAGGGRGGSAGGGAGAAGAAGGAAICASGSLRSVPVIPTPVDIIVALDRSTGMNRPFDDGPSLAEGSALVLDNVVARYQYAVRFGLAMFPTPPGPGGSCGPDPSCCVGPAGLPTSPGLNAFDFNLNFCNQSGVGCPITSQRPIAAALDSCLGAYSAGADQADTRYVLLLTSGDPGCGVDACRDAQFKVSTLTSFNVKLEVVALGNADEKGCLAALAFLGGASGARKAATSVELMGTVEDIVKRVGREACTLELRPPMGAPPPDQLVVSQDGAVLPNGSNGWDFEQGDRLMIRLRGTACDRFLTQGLNGLSVKSCDRPH